MILQMNDNLLPCGGFGDGGMSLFSPMSNTLEGINWLELNFKVMRLLMLLHYHIFLVCNILYMFLNM